MPAKQDLTGIKIERLTFLRRVAKNSRWEVQCDCGGILVVCSQSVKSGNTSSCGCLKREETVARNKAGEKPNRKTREYKIWAGIKSRCYNPKCNKFQDYGAKGITMSEEWRNSFDVFLYDMGFSPTSKHSIDRIKNHGNYEAGNCRWATQQEQGRNRRTNVFITYAGETLTIGEWGERALVPPAIFQNRIRLSGWSFEDALTTPPLSPGVNKRHGPRHTPCMQPYSRKYIVVPKKIVYA